MAPKSAFAMIIALVLVSPRIVTSTQWMQFDHDWKFHRGDSPMSQKPDCSFPQDLNSTQCLGLTHIPSATATSSCAVACCNDVECETWQFCPTGAKCDATQGCWIGQLKHCSASDKGWISRARHVSPSPPTPTKCITEFCKTDFDDSTWSVTETPHDWATEDLPTREDDIEIPVFQVRNGTWLFSKTDTPAQSDPLFDDKDWKQVEVPHDWRTAPSNMGSTDKVLWYRRHLPAGTAAQMAASAQNILKMALGTVLGSATVYLNGVNIGKTSDGGCSDELRYTSLVVPLNALSNMTNVVALRVAAGDTTRPGGLFDSMAPDMRVAAFDPGASPGQKQTGYTLGGVGWYRKAFTTTATSAERTMLRFDGVYMHADVYVNEVFLGSHPYGYTTFEFDITDHMTAQGKPNVLAIRVASMGSNSRWFAGAGIFRHVWITNTPLVHALTFGGVQVVASQEKIDLASKQAELAVFVTVMNAGTVSSDVKISTRIFNPDGSVATANTTNIVCGATTGKNVSQTISLSYVQFWGPDSPSLYSATVTITTSSSTLVDHTNITFGVRHITFDSATGFMINGESLKLRGGCVHHDNGALGSKSIGRAEERRVEILKENGYNAIRTSHNPVSPAFVAACDKLGMLLMEEAFDCWDGGKNSDDYHLYFDEWWQRDIISMVLRDINSPSIIMWSIGNEIPIRRTPKGIQLSSNLSNFIRSIDPKSGNGRGITSAYPGVSEDETCDDFLAPLDVAGYNYGWSKYVVGHQRKPERVIAGTESFPLQSFQTWQAVLDNDWVIGDFIWTAIDYIGESAIGGTGYNTPDMKACSGYCPQGWSWHISFCGDIDIVGHRKPQSYYRAVMWNVSQLEIAVHEPVPQGQHEVVASWGWPSEFPSWSWDETTGTNFSVNVYSRYVSVDLLLNGKPVTTHPQPTNESTQFTATFQVPYAVGTLTAVGYDSAGHMIANKSLVTAGVATALRLTPDRSKLNADRDDLSYVTCEVVDAHGNRVPNAALSVSFSVSGDGELAAVGSGDPADTSSFQSKSRITFLGRAMAILRPGTQATSPMPGGSITITASADGLTSSTATITY